MLVAARIMTKAVAMKSKRAITRVENDYLALVKRFPLRPLSSRQELETAGEILDRYIGRDDLTPGERDYVAGLLRFVEDYEKEHLQVELKRLTPIQLLKHLMEENEMSTTDVGCVLGSRGLASEVLNGNRGLSKTLIAKLAAEFTVNPGLFLDMIGSA
jgi:HTH-type transcriptional regulator/antitoxin HigA